MKSSLTKSSHKDDFRCEIPYDRLKTNYNLMKSLFISVLFLAILAMGACASSKPCPAYAKAEYANQVKG